MGLRYVIISEDFGVYLGEGRWSGINPAPGDSAPTFIAEDPVKKIIDQLPGELKCSTKEAKFDSAGFRVSAKGCAEQFGLEPWEDVAKTPLEVKNTAPRPGRADPATPTARIVSKARAEKEAAAAEETKATETKDEGDTEPHPKKRKKKHDTE